MRAGWAQSIEASIDRAASGLFAMAVAYASWILLPDAFVTLRRGAAAALVAAAGYALVLRILSAIQPEARRLPVPVFDVREMEPIESDALLLTERYEPSASEEPLILDDVLGALAPDSRVVRLFDPAAMPTAGELNNRIRRHLVRGAPPAPSQDASQALHDALAELRRSLR